MKIFLNPGHGGTTTGAISKSGVKECVIAAQITDKLCSKIIENNLCKFQVFQQKKSVTEISAKEINSNSDLFISIHCNSFCKSSANGVEVLFYEYSGKGEELAQIMQNALVKGTGLKDRGIVPRTDVHVLKKTKAPAILVELAFLSNPHEEELLCNYQDLFVDALYQGIKDMIEHIEKR